MAWKNHSAPGALLLGAWLALGCAGGPPPETEPPRPEAPGAPAAAPADASDPLQPAPAAVRTADRVSLTGLETGTMWTFENPPTAYWDSAYGFQPSAEWLDRVRLSSVRFGEVCSASFVSSRGLVMTNHHCARGCAEALSTAERDHVEDGFHAASEDEEKVCPDLALDQLVEIEDVTRRVKEAAPAGAPPTEAVAAQEEERERILEECRAASGLECQVVALYHGGQFQLYKYRRYSPVKLLFLPELQAGFFGGDPDNFTYPRYALDVAFVRAYQPDSVTPASTPHHFRWRAEGAREGELVFLTGNPGSTSRLATVAQLMYEERYRHPFILTLLEGQRALLRSIAARGPEAERAVRDDLFSIENSLKAFTGQLAGLRDTMLVGRKIRWEREFRDRVHADPELRSAYGDAWDRLSDLQREKLHLSPRLNVANPEFLGGPYENLAATLVRYIRETAKPEDERQLEFQGEALREKESLLRSPLRPDPEVAAGLLALRLEVARRFLPPEEPLRRLALQTDESPEGAAVRLIRETRVMDAAFRQRLMEGGPEALAGTTDPLVRLAVAMDSAHRELEARWGETTAAERREEARLAEALFAAFGTDLPPDATFTLRISDGVVKRYPYNGTFAPPVTTFHGLYARAAEFGGEMPWTLPPSLAARREALDLDTPLNFVMTNDITGGNSGSPVIDRDARVVGIAFDGNIEQLPNEFVYTTEAARAIGVHAAGILEALRAVYGAEALLRELLGEEEREAGGR